MLTIVIIISKMTVYLMYARPRTMTQPISDASDTAKMAPVPDVARREGELTFAQIREALKGLEYGEISIIVQDGVVIQIERLERKRLKRRRGG